MSNRFRLSLVAAAFAALASVVASSPWSGSLALSPAVADGNPDPADVEAAFDSARLRDDLTGAITDTAREVRIAFFATAGTQFDAKLSPAAAEGAVAATGLTLTLCNAAGVNQNIAGSPADKSKGDGVTSWKKVTLTATGSYVLIVRAGTAGGYRLVLRGAPKTFRAKETQDDVAPNEERTIAFDGVARGTLSYSLLASGRAGFQGELVSISQPSGNDLPMTPATAKGKVTLLEDGAHTLRYRNAGTRTGDAEASVKMSAARAFTRKVFVRPAGAVFVPFVKSVDPTRAFHREAALPFVITGRDFQAGADVRLQRSGRNDILGTSIEVRSETEIACVLDLDTIDTDSENSVGAWTVAVYHAPVYTSPPDRTTLVKNTPTKDVTKHFDSLASSSIRLPSGIEKDTEVWFVDFNDGFQTDIERMGFGSGDAGVRESARGALEAYTIVYLRDLFRVNETNGDVKKSSSVPVSFVVEAPPVVAGTAGTDYNRIEVGGAFQSGDADDLAEPLAWGFAPFDSGNASREDLSLLDASMTRIGRGARLRVLDPDGSTATTGFTAAMAPLRNTPLTAADARYFVSNFFPRSQGEADRFKDISRQTERAAREIAAIVAHHIGKAMGRAAGGSGPMANPTSSGEMWAQVPDLNFSESDVTALQTAAVPHELPGVTRNLAIGYFPLIPTQTFLLPDLTTDVQYSSEFKVVGGRPNATASSYRVSYAPGSAVPRELTLTFQGLSGKPRTMIGTNVFYCNIEYIRVAFEDRLRGGTRIFAWRLNVLPNIPLIPVGLQQQAIICRNTVLSTQ